MRIEPLDTDTRVLVIAEIGNNHEGDEEVAARLVDAAAEAGADAVKFQTFKTERFVAPSQTERYARMQRFELSQDAFSRLADRARDAGLLFISTPLDLPSAMFLETIVDALKIASGDNDFWPLLDYVAETGKPMILSTGFADLDLIRYVDARVKRIRAGRDEGPNHAVLHCVSAYPVAPEDANLAAVHTLAAELVETTIGYSDHTLGIAAAPLAVAAGARVIEKHFTLDRNYSDFRDHQLSADPAMMREMVERIREVEVMLGSGDPAPAKVERDSETPVRRSIAAATDLPAGHVIGPDDLMWIRPGDGIRPGDEHRVLGRRLKAALATGDLVRADALEG